MNKEQKIEGVGLLKGIIKLTKEVKMPINLYEEIIDWFEYNYPGLDLDSYQKEVLKAILADGNIPSTSKELAEKLKELLPGKTK